MFEEILLEKRGRVGIITFNRPEKLNAFTRRTTVELDQALDDLEHDDAIRAIVLTGAGDRAFCAGADINELIGFSPEEVRKRYSSSAGWTWHLASCLKPVVGALNGLAYGGGAMICSLLDMRIGCERTRIRFNAAAAGRLNATWSLPMAVGWAAARDLLFTARVVEPEEGLRIGLLNRVVPAAQLAEVAVETAEMIAANDPTMVQGIKGLMLQHIGLSWRQMLQSEAAFLDENGTQPAKEAFKAFLSRKPATQNGDDLL